jgi:hypothetical protein
MQQTAKASETHRKNARIKKTTERTLLRELVTKLDENPGLLTELLENILQKAKSGDKDAVAFFGKYLLGGGKIGLTDIYNPPIIRKG